MASLLWFAHSICFLLFHLHFQAFPSLSFSFNSSSTAIQCQYDQSLAFLQFKTSLSVKSAPSPWSFLHHPKPYLKTESWKEGTNCCSWDGITCDTETASFILWFTSGTLLFALWAFGIGFLVTVLHASVRTPNLKARLNTFREEFRAVWRNYSEL